MYQKMVLPNGVRLVMEKIDYVRSASVGIWVGNGSRHEPASLGGISHFIEHMIFKGTDTRTAQDIAIEMDAMGGQFNAFTTKECTCYYMKVRDTDICAGISVLADMFLHSRFDNKDIELERGVVLEEIGMYEDTPEDVAIERVFESCYEGTALGRPILGGAGTLNTMDSDALHAYMKGYYRPADTVIALSGHYTDEDVRFISDLFSGMAGEGRNRIEPASYRPRLVTCAKDIEQNHLCMGFPGISAVSDERYTLQLMNAVLGGGMSSRLFQRIREQNGLCYSIYSFPSTYEDTGMYSIYTALGKETEHKALQLICEVVDEFADKGPDEDELRRCREQIKANIMMGLESTGARMNQLGKNELLFGRAIDADELIAGYDAVTAADVRGMARRVLDRTQVSLCAVGHVDPEEEYASILHA